MKTLNEFVNESSKQKKSDKLIDIKNWIDDKNKTNNKLNQNGLKDIENSVRGYLVKNNYVFKDLGFGFRDDDLYADIAGYIIEAFVYDAIKANYNVTSRSGRGLKFDKQSIYWDFSINGLDEKFEIKSICKNGYHNGGISKTNLQKEDKDLIYIIIPYKALNTGFEILTNDIKVQR